MKVALLKPEYVEQFPDELQEGVLYISEEFSLTAHKCPCGCGEDVYLKLGPAKWRLSKNSDSTVSLDPSVGNWNYQCKSHYWIRRNRVVGAGAMDSYEIEEVQRRDRRDRDEHIAAVNAEADADSGAWAWVRSTAASALRKLRAVWPW